MYLNEFREIIKLMLESGVSYYMAIGTLERVKNIVKSSSLTLAGGGVDGRLSRRNQN